MQFCLERPRVRPSRPAPPPRSADPRGRACRACWTRDAHPLRRGLRLCCVVAPDGFVGLNGSPPDEAGAIRPMRARWPEPWKRNHDSAVNVRRTRFVRGTRRSNRNSLSESAAHAKSDGPAPPGGVPEPPDKMGGTRRHALRQATSGRHIERGAGGRVMSGYDSFPPPGSPPPGPPPPGHRRPGHRRPGPGRARDRPAGRRRRDHPRSRGRRTPAPSSTAPPTSPGRSRSARSRSATSTTARSRSSASTRRPPSARRCSSPRSRWPCPCCSPRRSPSGWTSRSTRRPPTSPPARSWAW